MTNPITIRKIDAELEAIATADLRINHYFFGSFLDAYTRQVLKYTSMVADVVPSITNVKNAGGNHFSDFSITIAISDQVFEDRSNEKNVKSETFKILQDVINVMQSKRWSRWAIIKSCTASYFRERGSDVVDGWVANVSLRVINLRDLCAIPLVNYDLDGTLQNNCAGVKIYLDGIYEQTVASGGRFDYTSGGGGNVDVSVNGTLFDTATSPTPLNIPVLNSLSNSVGTVNPGVNVTIDNSIVSNSDSSFSNNIPAEENYVLPDIRIKNSLGSILGVYPSVKDYTVANDSVRNSDSSYIANDVVQGVQKVLPNITFTDTDGSTSSVPSVKNISATLINALSCAQLNNSANGLTTAQRQLINRVYVLITGQTVVYRTGDNGTNQAGRLPSFTTLNCNNAFGNTNRFTDTVGGQTYANNIVCDWATMTMWYRLPRNVAATYTWNVSIDDALTKTYGGFSWRLPTMNEAMSIINAGNTSAHALNYAPFNIGTSGFTNLLWCSTTQTSTSANAYAINSNGGVSPTAKTNNGDYIPCRTFTLADLGL